MIDEREIVERFHAALDVEVPTGAAQRLRADLLREGFATSRGRRSLRISLRFVAGIALAALAVAATGTFLALHRPQPAPAAPLAHVGARDSWGMVSASVGYEPTQWLDAWGNHIVRTADGGRHWSDVTPTGFVPDDPSPSAVYLLDADHVWLIETESTPASAGVYVMSTANGGRSWVRGGDVTFGTARPQVSAYFADARNGWLLLGYSESWSSDTGGPADQLWRTRDGGSTWALVSRAEPGCRWEALAFLSSTDGWIQAGCSGAPPGSVGLIATHDGGATWSSQSIPGVGAGCVCTVLPKVLNTSTAVVLIRGGVVITTDGGASWTRRATPALGDPWTFTDAMHGWVSDGAGHLYRTTDGGTTWSRMDGFGRVPPATDLYFVDDQHGFAVVTQSDSSQGRLWNTVDGGQTWSDVGVFPPRIS